MDIEATLGLGAELAALEIEVKVGEDGTGGDDLVDAVAELLETLLRELTLVGDVDVVEAHLRVVGAEVCTHIDLVDAVVAAHEVAGQTGAVLDDDGVTGSLPLAVPLVAVSRYT